MSAATQLETYQKKLNDYYLFIPSQFNTTTNWTRIRKQADRAIQALPPPNPYIKVALAASALFTAISVVSIGTSVFSAICYGSAEKIGLSIGSTLLWGGITLGGVKCYVKQEHVQLSLAYMQLHALAEKMQNNKIRDSKEYAEQYTRFKERCITAVPHLQTGPR